MDADLQLKFAQTVGKAPELGLAGHVKLARFALQNPASEQGLSWHELDVQLQDVQPLKQLLKLRAVNWVAPKRSVAKDGRGQMQLAGVALKAEPAKAQAACTGAKTAAPWTLALEGFELRACELYWQDASTKPTASVKVQDLGFKLGAMALPLQAAAPINLAMRLLPANGSAALAPASLEGTGSLSAENLTFDWQWQGLDLQWLAPYLLAQLPLRVAGLLAGKGGLTLAQLLLPSAGQRAQATLAELQLTGFSLGTKAAREPLLRLAAMDLDWLNVDLAARKISVGDLKFSRPTLEMARSNGGEWNYQDLLLAAQPQTAAQPAAAQTLPPWALQLKGLKAEQGLLRWLDGGTRSAAIALNAAQINLDVRDFAWPASAKQAKAMPVNLSLKFGAAKRGSASLGLVQWQGSASLAPLSLSGNLRLERLPLHLLDPYLDPAWGLRLQKGELGLRAQFDVSQTPAGLNGQATAKLLVADLVLQQAREVDGQNVLGEELPSWQALKLDGIQLQLEAGSLPQLTVADVMLNDFFARVIINEQGKVILRDRGLVEPKSAAPALAQAAANAPVTAASATPKMPISIGRIRVIKGRLDFNDRFVRPNYSAQLSELRGSLGAFSSQQAELAPLSLRGRVAGTGLLDMLGNVNPLGKPPLLDIKATASDIELAPLSPYAAKYVGYAIGRGKFSTKLQYKVDAGAALQANNQFILTQLTYGERVEIPDATKLPVLFAVALLKDKNGVIDVEVPIKGSINEPEFSVGGVIWKVIANLLGKALSAPFALFSGNDGAEFSRVEFAPGSVQALAPANLDKVAKMMEERPGLSLTIKAWADPVAERGALQERQLDAALLAKRKREVQRELQRQQSPSASASPQSEAALSLSKDISAPEMRALLLSSFEVSEASVRALGLERGVMLRDALIAKGLANSRIFLGAPGLNEGRN